MTDQRQLAAFVARLRSLVGPPGEESKFARKVGIPQSSLNGALKGEHWPRAEALSKIAQATGKSLDWLLLGREAPGEPTDVVLVSRLDIAASAGPGALVEQELEREPLALSAQWLRRIGLNPTTTRALEARGNSMEPTIRDGDLVLVDVTIDELAHGAVYVLTYGGALLIKRLTFNRDGSVTLSSDNRILGLADERIAPDDLPGLVVAGRVRWYGRLL